MVPKPLEKSVGGFSETAAREEATREDADGARGDSVCLAVGPTAVKHWVGGRTGGGLGKSAEGNPEPEAGAEGAPAV